MNIIYRIPHKWVVTLSVPFTSAMALVSWPNPLSAATLFMTGANFAFALMLWWPALVPFKVVPPTPEQLEEMDRILRAKMKPLIEQIAHEAGFDGVIDNDDPPTTSRH